MINDMKIVFKKGKKSIVNRTKGITEVIKIKGEILEERKNIEQNYSELGKQYYEIFGNKPCEELKSLCYSIFLSKGNIKHLVKEINLIQKGNDSSFQSLECSYCHEKIEHDFLFCPKCGKRIYK